MLYPRFGTLEAVPQYISGRTSYLQVRLAFHRYPQLIPAVFNRHGFGPPSRDYRDFNLAMGRSPGFGSAPTDSGGLLLQAFALLGLGFPAAPPLCGLTLPASATRRFILQKARHHPPPLAKGPGSDCLKATGFRFYFTPLPGCFSPFPHGTGSLSVARSI